MSLEDGYMRLNISMYIISNIYEHKDYNFFTLCAEFAKYLVAQKKIIRGGSKRITFTDSNDAFEYCGRDDSEPAIVNWTNVPLEIINSMSKLLKLCNLMRPNVPYHLSHQILRQHQEKNNFIRREWGAMVPRNDSIRASDALGREYLGNMINDHIIFSCFHSNNS